MKTAIKERPILFSGDSIRAILDGKKTVTRRVVKCTGRHKGEGPRPESGQLVYHDGAAWDADAIEFNRSNNSDFCEPLATCPYGQPGDRLWVREAWRLYDASEECACYDSCRCSAYSGQPLYRVDWAGEASEYKWRPSIHMPRRLCRIVLEVKSVRVERLQEITEAECVAEGFERDFRSDGTDYGCGLVHAVEEFAALWDQLNAGRGHSWKSNPWVWRVEFERVINQG